MAIILQVSAKTGPNEQQQEFHVCKIKYYIPQQNTSEVEILISFL